MAKIRAAIAIMLSCLCFAGAALAQSLEYQVKAAFILNVTKFVEWPQSVFPTADVPMVLCVHGDGPLGSALTQLAAGESVKSHKLVVRKLQMGETPEPCHVLYVPAEEKDLPQVLSAVGTGVLTIGEGDGFLNAGGIISFVVEDRHVRFDVNHGAARRSGLQISAKLLSVARAVLPVDGTNP
ncbi:MAG TPA: YfiR family protein [Bryobacteraceae bacterium]|nr:YfiR family protein [Bryobacteraceae bacterium]